MEECGWTIKKRGVTSIWFDGNQFPPSAHNAHSKSEKARDGSVADDESSESEQRPPAKKARTLALGRKRRNRPSVDHLPETSRVTNDSGREGERESDGGVDDAVTNDVSLNCTSLLNVLLK